MPENSTSAEAIHAALERIDATEGAQAAVDLANDFVQGTEQHLTQLETGESLGSQDVEWLSYRILGDAGLVGAVDVAWMARRIRRLAVNGDVLDSLLLLPSLRTRFEHAKAAVLKELEAYQAP